jgi:hypothetical protein
MFTVVIENELNTNVNPLVIKEDINNIIQSIEEQLYNINISYRNNFRKIKNNLKLLEGVTESSLIVLEEDRISDSNLISYLTNVLELSLDCIVSTLYDEDRTQLEHVRNVKDLIAIDSTNTRIFKSILEQCEELFNVYSQVNEIEVSSTSFYELLDKSIELSATNNKKIIPAEIQQENRIYEKVLENLDQLVGYDLVNTYDNIKLFAASQVKPVNENLLYTVGVILGTMRNFITDKWKLLLGIIGGGAGTGAIIMSTYKYFFGGYGIKDLDIDDPKIKSILIMIEKGEKVEPASQALVVTYLKNLITNSNDTNLDKIQIILSLFKDRNIDTSLTDTIGTIQTNISNLEAKRTELSTIVGGQGDALKNLNADLENRKAELDVLNNSAAVVRDEMKEHTGVMSRLAILQQEFPYLFGTYTLVGMAFVFLLLSAYIIRSKVFGNEKFSATVRTILKMRKQIDAIRTKTLAIFPDLKIQFTYLDSEVKKCERTATIRNDYILTYDCGMKYFMGSYAIIMYATLLQLSKDGTSLSKFNKLSDVHNYSGFASLNTRNIIKELNIFYDSMITYDASLVEAFDKVFNIIKQMVVENRLTDNIATRLPNRLTTSMVGGN